MEIETIILPILALILSGLTWSLSGALADWRKNHGTPDWKGFDFGKLRNDLILGLVLGVGSVVYATMVEELTPIATAQEFFIAIGAGLSIVVLVDKLIIGGIAKR